MRKFVKISCFLCAIFCTMSSLTACEEVEANNSFTETMPAISAVTQPSSKEKVHYSICVENSNVTEEVIYQPEHAYEVLLYENPAIVTEDAQSADVRQEPKKYTSILGTVKAGGIVNILSDQAVNDYVLVESGGLQGYVAKYSLITGDQVFEKELALNNVFAVIQEDTRLLMEDKEDTVTIGNLSYGHELQIISVEEDYYEVIAGDTTGYIPKDSCKIGYACFSAQVYANPIVQTPPTTPAPTTTTAPPTTAAQQSNGTDETNPAIENMIAYGMQFMGVRYVYGGTSLTNGLDCSSYTQQVFKNGAGISLLRTSYWQCDQGTGVPVSERKRGDLLFYAYQSSRINHVAIYLGNNQILHSSMGAGCVTISAYNYCGEPVVCRRFF